MKNLNNEDWIKKNEDEILNYLDEFYFECIHLQIVHKKYNRTFMKVGWNLNLKHFSGMMEESEIGYLDEEMEDKSWEEEMSDVDVWRKIIRDEWLLGLKLEMEHDLSFIDFIYSNLSEPLLLHIFFEVDNSFIMVDYDCGVMGSYLLDESSIHSNLN